MSELEKKAKTAFEVCPSELRKMDVANL